MNLCVILVGSAVLLLLAASGGCVDGQARDSAWRNVAAERRANREERQRLAAIVDTLAQEAGACQCPVCRMVRWMSGQGDEPQGRAR